MDVSSQLHARPLYPLGNRSQHLLDSRLGGPQNRSGCRKGEKNLVLSGNRTRTLHFVTIPTELSRLLLNSERKIGDYFFPEILVFFCLFILIHVFPRVSMTRDKISDFPVVRGGCKRIHLTGEWRCIILTLRVAVNWGIPTVRASHDHSPIGNRVGSVMHVLVWSRWQGTVIGWSVPSIEFIMNYTRHMLHDFSISWSIL
jgi:hypothetical protein